MGRTVYSGLPGRRNPSAATRRLTFLALDAAAVGTLSHRSHPASDETRRQTPPKPAEASRRYDVEQGGRHDAEHFFHRLIPLDSAMARFHHAGAIGRGLQLSYRRRAIGHVVPWGACVIVHIDLAIPVDHLDNRPPECCGLRHRKIARNDP